MIGREKEQYQQRKACVEQLSEVGGPPLSHMIPEIHNVALLVYTDRSSWDQAANQSKIDASVRCWLYAYIWQPPRSGSHHPMYNRLHYM